jgi:hypothetical protein
MKRRAWSVVAMLVVAAVLRAVPATGADPSPAADAAANAPVAKTPAARAPVTNAPATKASTTKASTTKASTTKASTTKASTTKATLPPAKDQARRQGSTSASQATPRRLDDIHIEGEIPVPQVLFITARDQRRFMDFQHRRYLKTSRELGEATAYPTRIVVTGTGGNDDRKETSR